MDDIPDVVSARRFREFDKQQKEELYETLLNLSEAIKDIPKKSLRKTLDVTFAVLQYKGEQVNSLKQKLEQQQQADSKDEEQERLLDENERLKRMLDKLEDEKEELKQKIKDLTDELLTQRKRLQDTLNSADISDKDSSDPLSELDKQEELLRNIARKNKHIKRLLKEIETLQGQNIEQSKSIIQLEKELQHEMTTNIELKNESANANAECSTFKNTINELSTEIARLEGNITYLEEERESSERDLKDFIERLEVKAQSWKGLLEEKENEVAKLQKKLKACGGNVSADIQQTDNGETDVANNTEFSKIMNTLELRDRQIEQLELKLKNMAEEMLATTQLMNKLSNEREDDMDPKKPRACCKLIEKSLQAANKRCREISEMLERSEEDNAIKSKQAMQALGALEAYQRGEDGLTKAIRKCSTLEQKIASRDKQIRSLVMQLNSMHEIANENSILRKRLNIPDDVVISTKNLAAKERSKEKIIDRLTLKLRASEEMRLQLKLEKTELRKQILELHKSFDSQKETLKTPETYNKSSNGEIGELSESLPEMIDEQAQIMCPHCHFKAKEIHIEKFNDLTEKPIFLDLQTKYQEVLEENETLRFGMHEILQKLREYDASSEHITIDSNILCRLLAALQLNSSPPHTPKRLEHDKQLLEKLALPNIRDSEDSIETDELTSIGSIRDASYLRNQEFSFEYKAPSSSMNTTMQPILEITPKSPSRSSPVAKLDESRRQQQQQQQIDELTVYKQRYEQLKSEMTSTRSTVELNEKITLLEIEITKLRSGFNYMREDFDQLLTKSQQNDLEHITETTELNKEIHVKNIEISELKEKYERMLTQSTQSYSSEQYEALMKTNAALQAQIAFIVQRILAGEIAAELKVQDICADYGIIEDNLQLNFIAAAEYEQQKVKIKATEQHELELERKTAQLEGLLNIAHSQIQSQQRLLNEITDNHIDLRHLVADLQSQTEEKHLLAKLQRELNSANAKIANFTTENDELNQRCKNVAKDLDEERQRTAQLQANFRNESNTKELKIKFLLLSLYTLKEKYTKFTPLIFLTNFVFAYTRFTKKIQEFSSNGFEEILNDKLQETLDSKLTETKTQTDDSSNLIKLVKAETQCKLLKAQLESLKSQYGVLQVEINEQRIRYATEAEHWRTVEALCSNQMTALKLQHQDAATNTDIQDDSIRRVELANIGTSPIATPVKNHVQKSKTSSIGTQTPRSDGNEMRPPLTSGENLLIPVSSKTTTVEATIQTMAPSVESQGVQTMKSKQDACVMVVIEDESPAIAVHGNVDVKKIQEELSSAHQHIEDLKRQIDSWKAKSIATPSQQCGGIIEKTIMSLNTLLMDKDKSISKYQDLLQNEREHNMALATKNNSEMENLRSTVTNLNFSINAKDLEILELKTKLEALSIRRNSNEKLDLAIAADENNDNSLTELSDDKIEEMFQQDAVQPAVTETSSTEVVSAKFSINEITLRQSETNMQAQLKDLDEKLKYMYTNTKIKEDEIALLREKLKLCREREKTLEQTQPEMERMRLLLEEKDKQINDLMDTLKNFHEDQKNFMEDNSSYSDAQILKLTSDLTRAEATTKIYQTQVEALRRQLTNLTQREKQAREQNQSLRNQLIKRPVVSIKTELNTRVRTENMQKRIQSLELELEESRSQIQRQQVVIEAKRAKSAVEVGLWEKQKRWQQNAEKLKVKLEETECSLEKTRTLLQSSRNTIARLEKDKYLLESKLGRAMHGGGGSAAQSSKFCRTPPSLHRGGSSNPMNGKYSPSESPETYTAGSSDYSSPSQSVCEGAGNNNSSSNNSNLHHHHHHHGTLIEALKARLELQQRKILAMELEGKGTNALTCELEKLQEKLSAIEAQNIRLEAKNLQLQLDNDLLRQNDATERLQKRIKHLEDYIIALKEELAQSEANRVVCKCAGIKMGTQPEQTILSLRNLVEKLRAENKYLKDGRRSCESRASLEAMPTDVSRLQQMYSDSLQKINALQAELNAKARSSSTGRPFANDTAINVSPELKYIKEQLAKKTQLLQKAKVLLTRAAAKEKVLKEQLALWKRKCSELQNVPVIEEISE